MSAQYRCLTFFAAIFVLVTIESPCFAQIEEVKEVEGIEELNEKAVGKLEDLTDGAFKDYAQRLKAILKTRRLEEREFVDKVVLEVQLGKLPKSLVDSSWTWVRDKRPHTRYPFIYFERVLRLQADKLKLRIPRFDYSIYNER